jgi:hypothetical protein
MRHSVAVDDNSLDVDSSGYDQSAIVAAVSAVARRRVGRWQAAMRLVCFGTVGLLSAALLSRSMASGWWPASTGGLLGAGWCWSVARQYRRVLDAQRSTPWTNA